MKDFSKIYKDDLDVVGKKAVELAELVRLKIPIPDGFVITTSFMKKFLDQTGISKEILEVEKINHPAIASSIEKLFDPIKSKIMRTHIPENLALEMHKFYKKHAGLFKNNSLNIFSSSPKNIKPMTFRGVKGDANFILKIKEIWASYIPNLVAIVVQKNINSKNKGSTSTNNPTKELEQMATKIQKHFYFPKEFDYVIEKNKIYITAIKPFTGVVSQNRRKQNVLIKGTSINPGIATGPVKILNNNHFQIKNGEIIVIPKLNKSLLWKIKKAKALVADEVLLNSYEQMVYRRGIKIPTVRARNAMKILQNGNIVTINGTSGEIYKGSLI